MKFDQITTEDRTLFKEESIIVPVWSEQPYRIYHIFFTSSCLCQAYGFDRGIAQCDEE